MPVVFPTSLTLQNRKKNHAGTLKEDQVDKLKQIWSRLFKLFEQPGEDIQLPKQHEQEETTKKGGFWGWGSKKEEPVKDYFLGATVDPRWVNLPLEKALPLIPGTLLRESFWGLVALDNPDATILRFLRARRWDLEASYNMLVNALRWRLEMRMNEIISLGEAGLVEELEKAHKGLGTAFQEQMKLKMVSLGGPDKRGRTVCFVNVQLHHKENQPLEVMKLLTIYIMETSRILCGYPMDTLCLVFNLDNFTLANMDFEVVKFIVTCFQAYYPETLGMACVYKAPWVFNTIWSLITPLLDPVVATKIVFPKSVEELEAYIDKESLPSIITGVKNPSASDSNLPKPGYKVPPVDDSRVKAYWEIIKDYESITKDWSSRSEFGGENDALDRLKLGQQYRIVRVKAEPVLRGDSNHHAKGLIYIDQDRLHINYNTPTWDDKDITEWV